MPRRPLVLDRIDRDAKILSGYDPRQRVQPLVQDERRGGAGVGRALRRARAVRHVARSHRRRARRLGGSRLARVEAGRVGEAAADRRAKWRRRCRWCGSRTGASIRSARTATHLDATPIILNSFTKSYIIDRAVRAALAGGSARAVVVNIGGDLVARGAWTETVGVTDPLDNADNAAPLTRLAVRDRAVATSGGYRRGFDIGGRHYSHIVDPRTGRPTSQVISATVVADRAADAGALATAFCVLKPEDSERARGERARRRIPDRARRRQPDPQRRAGGRWPPIASRGSACRARWPASTPRSRPGSRTTS